jgi:hypothetical protein
MSTQKLSKRELIKQIATGVEDPELREQLIDALLEREESRHPSWDSRPHMAVHPDAVPSNVRLHKWVNAIVGVVIFSLVLSYLEGTPETDTSYPFLQFATVFFPFLALLKHIQLSNVTKWQRRGRKPTRKFWGAMLQPSQKDSR